MAAAYQIYARSDGVSGVVWAALFAVCGVIVLLSFVVVIASARPPTPQPAREEIRDGESATFYPRHDGIRSAAAQVMLLLLGGWFASVVVIGIVRQSWLWPILAIGPAVYFLGFPVGAALGRYRLGGIWLTPTRLIDEMYGVQQQIALADIQEVRSALDRVYVVPRESRLLSHTRVSPRPWCRRTAGDRLAIVTTGVAGGAEGLAAQIRQVARTPR